MRLDEGKTLGDWKLIKEIGYGAIGYSFVAEHRFTKQKVVLKILPEDLASDRSFVMRFEEEVLLLAALDHPAIAKIHTVSFIEGLYLLVVECVVDSRQETKSLATLAKEVRLTKRQVLHIARQLAEALDYAHSIKTIGAKSFSHGNLKPSNILISASAEEQADARIRVKISDFGISRIVGQATWLMRSYKALIERLYMEEVKAQLAERGRVGSGGAFQPSGAYSGTHMVSMPASHPLSSSSGHISHETKYLEEAASKLSQNIMFLSPEQRRGDWTTSHESDVWSFGVILYWLLTGSYPEGVWADIDEDSSVESAQLYSVIKHCLAIDPLARPSELLPLFSAPVKASNTSVPHDLKEMALQTGHASPQERVDAFQMAPDAGLGLFQSTPPLAVASVMPSPSVRIKSVEEAKNSIKEYIPEKRDTRHIEPIDSEMVSIPQGSYARGSTHGCRDEIPRHTVRLNAFMIDIHPVTNEQFVRFLEFVGDEKDKQNHDIIRLRDSRIKKSSGRFVIERGYAKHPVVGVTWYGASAYASWVGKRLPTEAEWEIACYGGLDNPPYPTGEDVERSQANFFSSDTTAVMSYPPNGYGIYDMAGNVYEWCADWYEYNYYDFSAMEPDNPKGPIQGVYRVLRGGCWKSLKEDLRCAKRHRNNPGAANGTYGFRCCI